MGELGLLESEGNGEDTMIRMGRDLLGEVWPLVGARGNQSQYLPFSFLSVVSPIEKSHLVPED